MILRNPEGPKMVRVTVRGMPPKKHRPGHSLTPMPDISGFDFKSKAVLQSNLGQAPVLVGAKLLAAALLGWE